MPLCGIMDRAQVTIFALSEVSAAFDTADHDILSDCLLVSFGIFGKLLDCFCFYLALGLGSLDLIGSPLLLSAAGLCSLTIAIHLYTTDISTLVAAYDALCQPYADDIQAYYPQCIENTIYMAW